MSSGDRMTTGSVDTSSFGCATADYARNHPGECSPR
jgi:hypothetical protein